MVTIHLNSKEIGKITFWNAHNHDKRYDADMRFPYNDFCIDIKDAKMGDYLIYVHLVDYKVHSGYAETVVNGKKRIIEVDSLEETMNKLHDEKNVEDALEKSKELWVDILPIGIMAYIVNKSAKRKLEIKEERRALKAKTGSNRPVNNSNDKVYLLDDIVRYTATHKPTGIKHNITCPAWEVRGYYRHYKSGKTVWVNGYRKGKERNNAVTKNIDIFLKKS